MEISESIIRNEEIKRNNEEDGEKRSEEDGKISKGRYYE